MPWVPEVSTGADPALAALGWALRECFSEPRAALFVNARPGLPLPPRWQLDCLQGFRPWHQALRAEGRQLLPITPQLCGDGLPLPAGQACILLLPSRQREAARAEAARALLALGAEGWLIAAQANELGARSYEADLRRLCPALEVHSKRKCRVMLARATDIDRPACVESSQLDAARPLRLDGRIRRPLLGAPGLFSADHIDPGSALLIEQLPADLCGAAADLGAGVGVLSAALLERCRGLASLDLFEAEARAVALAQANLAAAPVPLRAHWCDVATGFKDSGGAGFEAGFDLVVSNPPFHVGARGEPALGQAFIRSAAAALKPAGQLWLVANAHLPYETTLAECFQQQRVVAEAQGFKILQAAQPRR